MFLIGLMHNINLCKKFSLRKGVFCTQYYKEFVVITTSLRDQGKFAQKCLLGIYPAGIPIHFARADCIEYMYSIVTSDGMK